MGGLLAAAYNGCAQMWNCRSHICSCWNEIANLIKHWPFKKALFSYGAQLYWKNVSFRLNWNFAEKFVAVVLTVVLKFMCLQQYFSPVIIAIIIIVSFRLFWPTRGPFSRPYIRPSHLMNFVFHTLKMPKNCTAQKLLTSLVFCVMLQTVVQY